MLEKVKNVFSAKDEEVFTNILLECLSNSGIKNYYDNTLSELLNTYHLNKLFITREEIALFIAFRLFTSGIYKNLEKVENEAAQESVFKTAEQSSFELILMLRELGFEKITSKIDLSSNFEIVRLEKNAFYKNFYKKYETLNKMTINEELLTTIKVFFPNEDGSVCRDQNGSNYINVKINPYDLPAGFLRSGLDFSLVNKTSELCYKRGYRTKNHLKEGLAFTQDDFDIYEKNNWINYFIP